MKTVISRTDAANAARLHFYTGRPCVNGHDAPRFVSNGGCVQCNADRMKAFNSTTRKTRTSRQRGLFTYLLHDDDHAAALAYCQALDMSRGRAPQLPAPVPAPQNLTPEQLKAERNRIFNVADADIGAQLKMTPK